MSMPLIPLFLLFNACMRHIHALSYTLDWTVPGGLPYRVTQAAFGYSSENNTIFMLGGYSQNQGLTTLNLSNEVFTLSDSYFTTSVSGSSQYYAQIHNNLYMIKGTSEFMVFDLNTATMSYPSFPSPPSPFLSSAACMAAISVDQNDYLFILGQGAWDDISPYMTNKVQILNLTDSAWLSSSNVPNMIKARSYFACIAHDYQSNAKVYAVGGWGPTYDYILNVEVLDVTDLFDNLAIGSTPTTWTQLGDILSGGSLGHRATTYLHDILIFGFDSLHVVNTQTNTIQWIGESWSPLYSGAVLMSINTVLYAFGSSWGYTDLPVPPTKEPTAAPSHQPSSSPTVEPTLIPSGSPTTEPTTETMHPSTVPSLSPTHSPSTSPTAAPTRFPTITDAYDHYIDVVYGLRYFSSSNSMTLVNDAVQVILYMERIIERGYVVQEDVFLVYSDFWCKISTVNDYSEELSLQSTIECNKAQCDHLLLNYNEETFTTFVTEQLRYFFAVYVSVDAEYEETLEFYVISMANEATPIYEPMEQIDIEPTKINIVFYVSLLITCMLIFIGFIACCYNDGVCFNFPKCTGCVTVDDGRYVAMIIFALHFYDFSSDINLSIEILNTLFIVADADTYASTLLIVAVASLLFIIVPYGVNLYYAANVKNTIINNEYAESWFNNHSRLFTLLVVLTGGCYSSLVLVSSNIFGLDIFSSGLTRYELKGMAKMRILGNVILENVPQLILQLIYAFTIEGISQGMIFAFIASLLSVISAVLTYCLDQETHNVEIVKYYLVTECNRHIKHNDAKRKASELEGPATDGAVNNDITDDDKANIKMNKGRRRQLAKDMGELFGVPRKNIQIGGLNVTTYGFITYIVHYINAADLVSVEDVSKESQGVTKMEPEIFITSLYSKLEHQVNDLFRQQFNLNDDFYVRCEHHLSMLNRVVSLSVEHVQHVVENQVEGDDQDV